MRFIESISSDLLPTSFVKRQIKYADDRGNGEAKLYLKGYSNEARYIQFFESYRKDNVYLFDKDNLFEYLKTDKIMNEYCRNSEKYKDIDEDYWKQKIFEIERLEPNELVFNLEHRWEDSQGRYYIKSSGYAFKDLFRAIALPKITKLTVDKFFNEKNNGFVYMFRVAIK